MRFVTSSHDEAGSTNANTVADSSVSGGESFGVGVGSAEQLFDDVSESSSFANNTTNTPKTEPTSEAARVALEARRRLFNCSTALHDVADAEMRAEVERDMTDGVAAVPPLSPAGWRVVHPSGANFFTMTRVQSGGYMGTGDGNAAANAAARAEEARMSPPRYRSVHDVMSGRHIPRPSAPPPPPPRSAAVSALVGRGNDSGSGSVRYARSDLHVTLFAPFRTLDITLFDPTVAICEWTRFDVLVRKTRPATSSRDSVHGGPATPLVGQQEVWDEGRCLFLRLACVNGELRIRSLQCLSQKLARALEEHAVFGKGEPLYLELLRRQRRERTVRRAGKRDRWQTAVSPVRVMDAPETAAVAAAAAAQTSLSVPLDPLAGTSTTSDAASHLLLSQFDRSGEYARTFAYGGPYVTELSKEMREALLEYVMLNVGITNEVAEYVCQMQFFLEQEEYVGWMAQWGQLASTLRRTL